MKGLTWPHVAVVFIIVAGVVTLGAFKQDATALIGLGLALLIGLGLVAGQVAGSQNEIKSVVNGNISRLVSLVEAMAKQMHDAALATPPPAATATPAEEASRDAAGGGSG